MQKKELRLDGILPPLTTPFNTDGAVDLEALKQNIAFYNDTGLAGYVALGSNGEAVHLTTEERASVIETIRSSAADGMTIVAGVNELSTRAAIEAARRAADAGAHCALVVTPYFYKSSMTSEPLARHFTEVADSSPIPLLIYNVPQNTGVVIDSASIARLSAHANIIGVKDSSGNMGAIAETIRLSPAHFNVMCGNGSILYPALMMGARGAILAVACAAPRAAVELFNAARSGDTARARDLQNRIAPLSHIVTAGLGVAGLKSAMDMAGLRGAAPRGPLADLSETERERVRAVMRQCGLFPDME
ncbi:MAG: dihydrodipicolinate synthase family protein [Acidobacteriota bacterium]